MDKNTDPCPIEGNGDIGNNVTSSKNPETLEQQILPPTSQIVQNTMGVRKNYKRVVHRGKKGSSQVLSGRRYTSGSSENGARVLRSRSSSKTAPVEPVQIPVQPPAKRRKRGRPSKGSPRKRGRPSNGSQTDEFSQFRKRIRYILNRMNYEQSFIEAYANDGWKSQSLEKIRPEKELDRAKGEILKCKLQIREVFQNLDSLLTKGKIDESLFDSDGEIACEDIFCATCGSKDVTSSNDIILCDGVCDRGFHQNCLNPPLLSEDIPEGDEGWLCPACDCKINCIDVINELQGSNLSIEDSWEKVFPEAAAMASGSKQDDTLDLPSDDSEDDDFDPDMAEGHMASKEEGSSEEDEGEGSDSDDSNFLTSSDDSEPLMDKKKADDLGLPSEDSEDDDYDPACPDSDKDIQNEKPCSDDSDFTSDSDDFCAEIAKSGGHDEVTKPSFPDAEPGDTINDHERNTVQANTANASLNSLKTEMYQNLVLRGSGRREVERLDYKKLYDETYDKESSDSSDNKEWSGNSTPEKGNQEPSEAEANLSAGKSSRKTRVARCSDELTPTGSADQKCGGGLTSNGSNSTTMKGRFGPIVNQRLREHFKTEQYPSRTVKESLAEELGITSRQVSRWFETRRRFAKAASAKKGVQRDCPSDERTKGPVVASMQVKDPENIGMEKPDLCRKETENDSDFTSDSDDFCAEIAKSGGHDEVTEPSFPDAEPGDTINDNERNTVQANTANASLNSLKTEMDQNLVLRGSGRREVERLDNKKLYDKTYDKESPDSSDDEEWSGNSTPEKGNQDPSEAEANLSAGKSSRKTRVARRSDELTPNGSADQKCGGGLTSNGSNSTTMKGRFGPIVNQRLHEHFKTEQYPSRAVKESLAEELGITSCQVSRWFETRRRFAKAASAKKGVQQDCPSDEKTKGPVVASMQVKDPEDIGLEKPDARRKETENEDATHLNECCKQQGGLKKRIKRGRGLAATPPGSKQGYATNSRNVRSPKGGSVSGARRSNGNSTEGQIPEVELADETRKKVIQRGLKKKKTSR